MVPGASIAESDYFHFIPSDKRRVQGILMSKKMERTVKYNMDKALFAAIMA